MLIRHVAARAGAGGRVACSGLSLLRRRGPLLSGPPFVPGLLPGATPTPSATASSPFYGGSRRCLSESSNVVGDGATPTEAEAGAEAKKAKKKPIDILPLDNLLGTLPPLPGVSSSSAAAALGSRLSSLPPLPPLPGSVAASRTKKRTEEEPPPPLLLVSAAEAAAAVEGLAGRAASISGPSSGVGHAAGSGGGNRPPGIFLGLDSALAAMEDSASAAAATASSTTPPARSDSAPSGPTSPLVSFADLGDSAEVDEPTDLPLGRARAATSSPASSSVGGGAEGTTVADSDSAEFLALTGTAATTTRKTKPRKRRKKKTPAAVTAEEHAAPNLRGNGNTARNRKRSARKKKKKKMERAEAATAASTLTTKYVAAEVFVGGKEFAALAGAADSAALNSMTVKQLRVQLRARNLEVSGLKSELVARLLGAEKSAETYATAVGGATAVAEDVHSDGDYESVESHFWSDSFPSAAAGEDANAAARVIPVRRVVDGPPLTFGLDSGIGAQAHGAVLGQSGRTVVLAAVVHDSVTDDGDGRSGSGSSHAEGRVDAPLLARALRSASRRHAGMVPLMVDYRERYHGVGKIPAEFRSRRDNAGRPRDAEILAARAVDRALRPVLPKEFYAEGDKLSLTVGVQSYDRGDRLCGVDDETDSSDGGGTRPRRSISGDPTALAINSASAALLRSGLPFDGPVGAVRVCLLRDGTAVVDPSPAVLERSKMDLLLAGTEDAVLMLEFGARPPPPPGAPGIDEERNRSGDDAAEDPGVPDETVADLIRLAHAALAPVIEAQREQVAKEASKEAADNGGFDDAELARSIGLDLPAFRYERNDVSASVVSGVENERDTEADAAAAADAMLDEVFKFVKSRLGDVALRLFGMTTGEDAAADSRSGRASAPDEARVHSSDDPPLLAKKVRGRREQLVQDEVRRLILEEFVSSDDGMNRVDTVERYVYDEKRRVWIGRVRGCVDSKALFEQLKGSKAASSENEEDDSELDGFVPGGGGGYPAVLNTLVDATHQRLLKAALAESALRRGTRGDGRGSSPTGDHHHIGLETIRPVEAAVPALPATVHGSALFGRGETRVLCTATLGAPGDGMPLSDPFRPGDGFDLSRASDDDTNPYDDLPVGSLRYIRSQQAMESDLNSKKVLADRERTGESGTLAEVRRAFLHYDFPAYSTGTVQAGGGGAGANRRAVGHGALAERAVLPALPPASSFPYAIRLTSEVTSSNGSSSMASACGATLALLDAGVPMTAPVAAVSVGLALGGGTGGGDDKRAYLLDITGTEDHYGEMDFKIAGTAAGITAMQLDVKRPLPVDVVVDALPAASRGRAAILRAMAHLATESSGGAVSNLRPRRGGPKRTAPRVDVIRFDPARKADLVGPGGAVLRQLEGRYGVSLDLSQEGRCLLHGSDAALVRKAKAAITDLVADVVEGGTYEGTVIEIKDFGAILELLRNKEGLLHVSELSDDPASAAKSHPGGNFGLVRDYLKVGDKVEVVCIGVDPVQGSIKLSRKRLQDKVT